MSDGLFLARATEADVEALAALASACHSHPWTRAQIAREVAAGPPGAVLVLRAASGPVAVCGSCAYRVFAGEMEILDVAVHPGWRRRGLGRFLVSRALGRASRAGAAVARLEVRAGNLAALSLYESLGFCRRGVRRGYYVQPVEDAVLMDQASIGRCGR
ncbi:MAG TPA: GNAT family N-acetyltransferase [Vicinamibacteria bacterium]|nr:GNAT family N-acetyltransferase [Vicinamibacteria bacterium]